MSVFRFAILGAGGIAAHFCNAVSLIDDCEVCAVASKSIDRAEVFAEKHKIQTFYDSYERMLEQEKPDCAYIATTANDHFRLSMMCVERGIPVLCEKAMFKDSEEAYALFEAAKSQQVFAMEAMWSRFLPAVQQVKRWLQEDRIGIPKVTQIGIGFQAPYDKKNRYFNPELGGGAALDVTVYAYELTTYLLNQEIRKITASAVFGETGVDETDHVSIVFEHTVSDLMGSLVASIDEKMTIFGPKGKIILPRPHMSSECMLYDAQGNMVEHFADQETNNGFTYEIQEVMNCVRNGKTESDVVPWKDTIACAKVFDLIWAEKTQQI